MIGEKRKLSAVESSEWISDPLHISCLDASVRWSRGNLGEFLPGVITPLTWDLWRATERSGRLVYRMLGLLDRDELQTPSEVAKRTSNIFFGWPAANISALRKIIDRVPGDAGEGFERSLLGDSNITSNPTIETTRRPIRMAFGSIRALYLYPGRLSRTKTETSKWWRTSIRRSATGSLADCQKIVAEVANKTADVHVVMGFATMIGQIYFTKLEALLPPQHRAMLGSMVTSGGELMELQLLRTLNEVANSDLTIEQLLDRYGYYGAAVGECLNHSWREKPTPLLRSIDLIRSGHRADHAKRHFERERRAVDALDNLRGDMSAWRLHLIRRALARVRKFTVWREEAKVVSLQTFDILRAAARRIGSLLHDDGVLSEANDAFFFSMAELCEAPFEGMTETAIWRRARRRYYQTMTIPHAFVGAPRARPQSEAQNSEHGEWDSSLELGGLGVSPGRVEGVARVILDPTNVNEFAPGEILVCTVTDPSWTPLFEHAGGVVTDAGGMLSHGAVIARELNLPCVVNSRFGTRAIQSGERIRIDGTTGEIVRLS